MLSDSLILKKKITYRFLLDGFQNSNYRREKRNFSLFMVRTGLEYSLVEARKAGASQSQQQAVMTIPPLSQGDATPRSQPSLEGHVTKDNLLEAETLWTLKLIKSHYSL